MSLKTSSTGVSPAHKTPLTQSTPPTVPTVAQAPSDTPAVPAPFPSPQTFDILPPLHALLVRLLSSSSPGNQDTTSAGPESTPSGQPGETLLPASGSLDPKALVTGASAVKIRTQKARNAIEALPDMDRTVSEQENEIAELEKRISRLKEVIGEFGERSEKVVNEL